MSNDEFVGLFLGALAMLGLLIFFLNRPTGGQSVYHFSIFRIFSNKDYNFLKNRLLGDRATTERLIQFEIDRMKPKRISRNNAIKRALYRLDRDNRSHKQF